MNEQEFNGQRYEPPRPAREGRALTPAGERAAADYPGTLHTGSISGIGTVASLQRINLRVKVPPKITKTKTILYNAEGKFISGNDGILGVNEWWGTIPPAVKELIIAGKKPVRITGRASQTGSPKRNEIVIANRIADVKTRLGNVAGRMDILPDSEFTAPNERSVVIRVEYTTAEEKAGGGAPAKP